MVEKTEITKFHLNNINELQENINKFIDYLNTEYHNYELSVSKSTKNTYLSISYKNKDLFLTFSGATLSFKNNLEKIIFNLRYIDYYSTNPSLFEELLESLLEGLSVEKENKENITNMLSKAFSNTYRKQHLKSFK